MKSTITSVLVIMVVSFYMHFQGCTSTGGSGPDSPPDIGDYFPLGVGYWWTYIEYDADGNQTGTHTTEFISSHTFPSGTVLYLYIDEPGNYEGHALKEDGLYHYSDDNLDESNLVKAIGNPVEEGDEILTEDGNLFTIVELDVGVTVPAGYFRCIEVKRENEAENEVDYYYLGLNAGLVKTESWEDGVYTGHSDLSSYFDEVQPPPFVYIEDYFPLGVGYRWTYDQYDGDSNLVDTHTNIIVSTHTFPSGTVLYLFDDNPGEYDGFAIKTDGLYQYQDEILDESNLVKVVNNPVIEGNTMIVEGETLTILSISEQVTVPAGSFTCILLEIEENGENDLIHVYLGRDVGMVRWEGWDEGAYEGYQLLVDYDFSGGGAPDIGDYWPLAVGNTWNYESYDEYGNFEDESYMTYQQSITLPLGTELFLNSGDSGPGGTAMKDDGFYVWNGEGYEESDLFKLIHRYPNVGDVIEFPEGDGYTQIISLNAEVETGIGNFDCIKGKIGTTEEGWMYFYLAREVGLVKEEDYDDENNYDGYKVITSYNLNP